MLSSNRLGEGLCRMYPKASFLDSGNILWKIVDNQWIGKRAVHTNDNSVLWLEETTGENVRSWPHGRNANYNEEFGLKEEDNKVNS